MPKVKIGDQLLISGDSDYQIGRIISLADHVAFVKIDGDVEVIPLRDIKTRLPLFVKDYTMLLRNVKGDVTGNTYTSIIPKDAPPSAPELRSLPKITNIDITRAAIRHIQMIAVGGIVGVIIAYFLF